MVPKKRNNNWPPEPINHHMKICVVATRAPKGMGPQNPTKKLAQLVDLLSQLLSRYNFFEILRPEHTPSL